MADQPTVTDIFRRALDIRQANPNGSYNERIKELSKNCGYEILIAGGSVQPNEKDIFPRTGLWTQSSLSYNLVWVNQAFSQYGF